MDLDRVLARFGTPDGVQVVLHVAELRLEVQPGRDAVSDTDLDRPERALGDDGPTRDLTEADIAVGGLRGNARVRPVDRDRAVGRIHARVARDLADPRIAASVLDDRGPVDPADPHGSGRRDLGPADGHIHGHVAAA